MADQGLTANGQPTLSVNEANQLVGIHNVTRDGAYMGAIRVSTGATLRQVATDVPIEAAQYPGAPINFRQVGEHYELDCEFMEQTLSNLRVLFDLNATPNSALLPFGKRARLKTMSQWCIYTEGPDGKNRRWTFFRAGVRPKGDVNIGHPTEVANVPITLVILADKNYPEDSQFGRVDDY